MFDIGILPSICIKYYTGLEISLAYIVLIYKPLRYKSTKNLRDQVKKNNEIKNCILSLVNYLYSN